MNRKMIQLLLCILIASQLLAQETVPPPPGGPEETPIEEEAQQQEWAKAFQEAEAMFNSAEQTSSIPMFENLVTKITEEKIKRGLTEPELFLLYKSLDYLGQANYNEGEQEKSSLVFLKLLELNPNYQLDESLVSSKIINFVAKIKQENLGLLNITSDPPGATVKLDNKEIGVTDLPAMYSLKGDHDLEISKPGFVPQKQTISVKPGKPQKLAFKLERSSSVAYFITYPKDVEILLNEKRLGVTGGNAAERAETAAIQQNLAASDFSAEFPVPELQPGTYEVTFRKPCWETQIRRVTIEINDDYLFEPVVLSPSLSYLNVTADDEKANVFIDNEYVGLAPLQKHQVCAGKHVLKIKSPRGKFETTVDAKKNQIIAINGRLNPSLTFLGLISEPGVLQPDLNKLTAEINQQLSGLQNLNYIDHSTADDHAAIEETLRDILEGLKTNTPDKDRRAKIQELCTRVESDLILIGYVPKEKLQRVVEFQLLSNWSSMADTRPIQVFDQGQWKIFKEQLEYEEPLFQKRLGAHLMDTMITPGPAVAQVILKANEDAQVLNSGDSIIAVNGKPVTTSLHVMNVLREIQAKEEVPLSIVRSGAQSEVNLKMTNSPMEIQFNNPSLLFNRQLIGFKKAYNLSINPLEKNIAMLNIGLCHMHFAEYDLAFDQLRQVQLDRGVGIGPGTVQYRIAQCYRELGYKNEASEALQEASKYPQNTIFSDDGPSLAREIERAKLTLR